MHIYEKKCIHLKTGMYFYAPIYLLLWQLPHCLVFMLSKIRTPFQKNKYARTMYYIYFEA